MKNFREIALILSLSLIILGCGSSSTTKTTRVVSEPTHYSERDLDTRKPVVTETTETTETTQSDAGCGGVLSCTVDVLGAIIALPFKAVGFLVDVIF